MTNPNDHPFSGPGGPGTDLPPVLRSSDFTGYGEPAEGDDRVLPAGGTTPLIFDALAKRDVPSVAKALERSSFQPESDRDDSPVTTGDKAKAIAVTIPGATAALGVVTVTGFDVSADDPLAKMIDEAVFGDDTSFVLDPTAQPVVFDEAAKVRPEDIAHPPDSVRIDETAKLVNDEATRPLYSAAPGRHLTPDPRQVYLAFLATLDPQGAIADVRAMLASVGGLAGFAIGGPARAIVAAGYHMDAVMENERERVISDIAFGVRAVQTADDRPLAGVFEVKNPARVLLVESVEGPPFDVRDRVEVLSQVRLYETLDAAGDHAYARIAAVVYRLNQAIAAAEHTFFLPETDMQDAAMAIVKAFCPDVITVSREP